ncbi:hypothetical protein CVT24_011132 [Panaeolus cyanescens]|uniref:Uncharacterized protein n=1 Tax=Panaeolus cyanescens TaxID=181874 RepID=A0A409YG62_9AGAR|nr:hypothetical protein CVT24_011132 [Panaeolus cyanescens]
MPLYQVPTAAALVALAGVSFGIQYLQKDKGGKIKLPTHHDEYEERPLHDPFDVSTPEDVTNGYPIDEEAFWLRVRLELCCDTGAVDTNSFFVAFGFSVGDQQNDSALVFGLHGLFSLYLVMTSGKSISQESRSRHWTSIIHLTFLTTLAAFALFIAAVLPDSQPVLLLAIDDVPILLNLWYLLVVLYTISAAMFFTTPLGPKLHYPPSALYSEKVVQSITNMDENNVCGIIGNVAASLDIGDLPIVTADMRAVVNYTNMKETMRKVKLRIFSWTPKPGNGWLLAYRLLRLNWKAFLAEFLLASVSAVLFYAPPLFLRMFVKYLEYGPFTDYGRIISVTGQLWSLATTLIQVRLKIQLNSTLFAKTLVRKDVASSAPAQTAKPTDGENESESSDGKKDDEDDFSSKAQVMTLMTTDVDRVSEFAWHVFALVDAPIEIVIGTIFLYSLLGVSCFIGLAVTCLFLPMNHYAGKVLVGCQENLMKARDERVALMNEVLGGMRMIKFMAWERSFEKRVLKIREKELKYQKLNYTIETLWNGIWNGSPILVTLISFWHFAIVRQQALTPSIAFTSILVFSEMKFSLSALPETFINMLQSFVSMRRIEKYLNGAEVKAVPPLDQQSKTVAFQNCTVTWPQDRSGSSASLTPSASSTPRNKFVLIDLTLHFPPGKLSLICGKLGSGKTLLLHALLGEADVLSGQVLCPRSPPDSLASFAGKSVRPEEWVVDGVCAYVPQAAWLRNASIKENILFNLPYDEERYLRTLEVCALVSDLDILEDGDESEIGERGVNLSGGQKARVSLARAVYSRASILFLDDVLSAVDAHTAHHLYHECLSGDLMKGRTVILVSHHVQLCAPGASYIVALDNGRVEFEGTKEDFNKSDVIKTLVQSTHAEGTSDLPEKELLEEVEQKVLSEEPESHTQSETSSTVASTPASVKLERKPPRKLVEEEKRAVGRISRDIWETYIKACGNVWYWLVFIAILIVASLSPVLENGWLRYWSNSALNGSQHTPAFYISVYAGITTVGLVISTVRWFVLYRGSIHASHVLYERLLEAVLFANIRFHDTVSRGRLLNRFGKDFEGIDSNLSDNFGRSIIYGLSAATTIITVSIVGGLPFILAAAVMGYLYWNVAKIYGQTSRDMRRLDSVTRSPLYSIYGETIAGVTIVRAFGASSKFLRDMLRCVDTNSNPYYWMWGVNRWLSIRFNLLSSGIVGATGVACLITPSISASAAGFALAFASTITNDLLFMVRRFVGLEQSMVALERVKEYTELKQEPPEFLEPRPPASWPAEGAVRCEDLVIRYAPELPDVLHHLNFEIRPGEKVGILGRTGSGKSTLALSLFRFVEATEGRILIDDVDIASIGLTDLRSRLTIIPQDPTILSGNLRSTLDVFDEYQDHEIYEALRRVHLIPSEDTPAEAADTVNMNVFRDLDSVVSEGGDNFSTGEKQLLCMARAILKRSKVLVMDEATASVDYATDELISKTIRSEFAESTILTIAHRLRTVIDYDRVMILEQGRIVEFDRPAELLQRSNSKFYALCKATGKEEFSVLKKMAGV